MESYSTLISSYGMSSAEASAAMGILGVFAGMAVTIMIIALVIWILLVIAQWKIFTKAGEKGWKALIPIYNLYIYCKIIGISFWKWFVALLVLSLVGSLAAKVVWLSIIASIASFVVSIILAVLMARNAAKAFGKGTGFAVGLFFLPNIFQLILGFGSAEYKGVPSKD